MDTQFLTIWSKSKNNPHWLIEKTYPWHYAKTALGLPVASGETILGTDGREYAWFAPGIDPNTTEKR